jgi:predicted nucleic acid-binding protein
MIKIYLDVCCLNRPFDDQNQPRIRLESEAVLIILAQCEQRQWEWVGSEVLTWEISKTPDSERRRRVQLLASHIHRMVSIGQSESARAQQIQAWGITAFDALHLACAESGQADVFLTTDDRLLRKATAHAKQLRVRVDNPLTWLREVSEE